MSPDYGTPPFTDDATRSTLATNTPAEDGRTNFRTSVIQLDRPGDPSVFDAKTNAEADAIIARYPAGNARSALGPMLHLVQSVQGQVSADGIAFCSEKVGLTKAQVAAFATFYTMYKRHPTGDYLVSVCTNTLCGVLGGDEIFEALKDDLGIGNNGTTADGTITIEHAECLAACDYAPVVTVNYEFFDNQTVGTARNLVSQLRNGDRPLPTRGAALCTFKQISRQIAGFYDDAAAVAADANSTGVPTERGVKLAIERGETAPSYSINADEPKPPAMDKPADAQPVTSKPDTSKPDTASPATTAEANADEGKPEPERERRVFRRRRQTSAHDQPLFTAESDEANDADPGRSE